MATLPRKTHRIPWSDRRDGILMDLLAEGCTLQRCADMLNISRNAAVGRFYRLCQAMGWQAA